MGQGLGVGNLCSEAAAAVLFMGLPALLMEPGKAGFRLQESVPEALAEGCTAPGRTGWENGQLHLDPGLALLCFWSIHGFFVFFLKNNFIN